MELKYIYITIIVSTEVCPLLTIGLSQAFYNSFSYIACIQQLFATFTRSSYHQ